VLQGESAEYLISIRGAGTAHRVFLLHARLLFRASSPCKRWSLAAWCASRHFI